MLDSGEKLLTIKEVLALAGVSRHTLYRAIKAEKIPAIYIGSRVRIKESDALAFAERMGENPKVLAYRRKDG